MSRAFRITMLAVFSVATILFGWQFMTNYNRMMAARKPQADTDITQVQVPDYTAPVVRKVPENYRLAPWGTGFIVCLFSAGLLIAHEASQFLAVRAMKAVYDEDIGDIPHPDYEKAEEAWSRGEYLEAIELLREYLKEYPRRQHAAIRIAEIYEKDLRNPLAAALEYEAVLQHHLPPERWGWAAIHLCNLYSGRLNQTDKAIALLRRVESEFGETRAGEKARERLEQLAADGVIPPLEPRAAESAPQESEPPKLPPGFIPRKH